MYTYMKLLFSMSSKKEDVNIHLNEYVIIPLTLLPPSFLMSPKVPSKRETKHKLLSPLGYLKKIHTHTCTHTCTRMHTHMHTHTRVHTCTHTHTHMHSWHTHFKLCTARENIRTLRTGMREVECEWTERCGSLFV